MLKCPGQDRYYWKPDDIFEVPCPVCDRPVEFLKTDPRRTCDNCGYTFNNPRMELGCARWCAYAKECLGFVPWKRPDRAAPGPLVERLIAEVKRYFGKDYRHIAHALKVYENAQELLHSEGGDPRVVAAAALLHDVGIREAERKHGSSDARLKDSEGPPIAERIMEKIGLDAETIEHVCCIIGSHHSGDKIDTVEFRIIWDADHIVNLQEQCGPTKEAKGASAAEVLRTKAGREMLQQTRSR